MKGEVGRNNDNRIVAGLGQADGGRAGRGRIGEGQDNTATEDLVVALAGRRIAVTIHGNVIVQAVGCLKGNQARAVAAAVIVARNLLQIRQRITRVNPQQGIETASGRGKHHLGGIGALPTPPNRLAAAVSRDARFASFFAGAHIRSGHSRGKAGDGDGVGEIIVWRSARQPGAKSNDQSRRTCQDGPSQTAGRR